MEWLWILWIFFLVETIFYLPDRLRSRLRSLYQGKEGIKYVPLVLIVLFLTIRSTFMLSELLPFLKWGWLGYNIALFPIKQNPFNYEWIIITVVCLVFMCLICNYWEEEIFRKSYRAVLIWSLLHLAMGIPLYATIPLFFSGIVYKHIYDKYSIDHAFACHFFTNLSLILLILAKPFLFSR